ncbi:MAG: hypothetical protein LBM67_06760 [Lentimicrobiaceae bacterium]|jgi:hypothetical protein|nr:hypothetical protein [Lentimicrobiaceae bacterium]
MKKYIGIFFFFIIAHCSMQAQISASVDTATIYKRARLVMNDNNPEKLAHNLTENYTDDASKVLSMAYWITRNIKYQYSGLGARTIDLKSPAKVLKTKKALSTEYAQLFMAMCKAVDIKAETVDGYIKDFDFFPGDTLFKAEHTWNIVKIDNDWYIVDLTYAGSTFNTEVSKLSKLMYTLFRVPQSNEMKPVKKYSPQWICMSPTTAVRTHLPVLSMFQLLKNPVTIEQFQQRDTAIMRHLKRYPQKQKDFSAIDYFVELPQIEKYKILASEVLQQNPFAHLNAAFYNFYVVELFVKYHYLDENGHLFATQEDLRNTLLYAQKADTLFQIAIKDDVRRLKLSQTRSNNWKQDLLSYNKLHQAQNQALSKRYAKSQQNIQKLTTQIPTLIAWLDKNTHKFNSETIKNQPRPVTQRNDELYIGMDLLEKADSLHELSEETMQKYEDLLGNSLKVEPRVALENQQTAKALNERNTRILRNYIKNKNSNMPMVYITDKSITKEVFTKNMRKIDSLYTIGVEEIANTLESNFSALNTLLKEYTSLAGQYANTLLIAKSKVVYDSNEDARYIAAVEEYTHNVSRIQSELKQIQNSLPEFAEIVKSEEKLFSENSALLKEDNMLETVRNKRYIDYRKKYRQIDVEYIKYYIKQNKDYTKLIQKVII